MGLEWQVLEKNGQLAEHPAGGRRSFPCLHLISTFGGVAAFGVI